VRSIYSFSTLSYGTKFILLNIILEITENILYENIYHNSLEIIFEINKIAKSYILLFPS